MKMMFTLVAMAALMLAAGCATPRTAAAPGPIPAAAVERAKARWPDASAETLEHGRGLFLSSCNRCHGYPDRDAYSEEEWPEILQRMGKRAKLSQEEIEHVLRFILATRTDQ